LGCVNSIRDFQIEFEVGHPLELSMRGTLKGRNVAVPIRRGFEF